MIPGLWHAKFDDVQQRFSSTVVVAAVPFCKDNIVVFLQLKISPLSSFCIWLTFIKEEG